MNFALAPHVTATPTEHGVVLLDERTGRYWQMNDTAALVLRCLLDVEAPSGVRGDRGCGPASPTRTTRSPQDVTSLVDALRAAKVAAS